MVVDGFVWGKEMAQRHRLASSGAREPASGGLPDIVGSNAPAHSDSGSTVRGGRRVLGGCIGRFERAATLLDCRPFESAELSTLSAIPRHRLLSPRP